MKQYWTYMLRCRDGSYYIGMSSDVNVREAVHAQGIDPKSYVYGRRPVTIVWSESFASPDDAIRAEKRLKGWSRAKKEALIRGDWDEIRRLARSHALRQAQDDNVGSAQDDNVQVSARE
jgi:predicted GIY-YIG superfamily endonuclease